MLQQTVSALCAFCCMEPVTLFEAALELAILGVLGSVMCCAHSRAGLGQVKAGVAGAGGLELPSAKAAVVLSRLISPKVYIFLLLHPSNCCPRRRCVHVGAGSVTPLPQPGNPKPRSFRLPELG